jgi:hypothetical protein
MEKESKKKMKLIMGGGKKVLTKEHAGLAKL